MKIPFTFKLGFAALLQLAILPVMAETMPDEPVSAAAAGSGKLLLGWLENIRIYPGGMIMKAKLDSGARSNALHAENIKVFERDNVAMVSFTILKDHDDLASESIPLELPIEKQVNIKLRYTPERDERPVVKLDICIAGTRHTSLFSLAERTDFNYPVLLGREFMQEFILIDPSESFTHRTGCSRL